MFGISARSVHLSRGFGTAEASAPALRSSLPWPPRLCLLVNDLGGSPFLVLAEDHLPGGGLQDAGEGSRPAQFALAPSTSSASVAGYRVRVARDFASKDRRSRSRVATRAARTAE